MEYCVLFTAGVTPWCCGRLRCCTPPDGPCGSGTVCATCSTDGACPHACRSSGTTTISSSSTHRSGSRRRWSAAACGAPFCSPLRRTLPGDSGWWRRSDALLSVLGVAVMIWLSLRRWYVGELDVRPVTHVMSVRGREQAAAPQDRLELACEAGLQPFRTALADWRSTEKDGSEVPPWVPQLRSLVQAGVPRVGAPTPPPAVRQTHRRLTSCRC